MELNYPDTNDLGETLEFLKKNQIIDSYSILIDWVESDIFKYSVVKDKKECYVGHADEFSQAIVTFDFVYDPIDSDGRPNTVICNFDMLDKAIKNILALVKYEYDENWMDQYEEW